MKHTAKQVLKAVVSLMIIVGLAVQAFAEERPTVPPGGNLQLGEQNQNQPSVAEEYLFRLAKKSKGQRMVRGGVYSALGAALLAKGISMLGREDDEIIQVAGFFAVVTSGLPLAGGLFSFAFQGRAERTYKQIQAIADRAQREKACEDALARLAKKGRKGRLVWGGVLTALTASMTASFQGGPLSDFILPASLGAGALYLFLVKGPAEKANRAYLEKKALQPTPTLVFGLAPRGGFRVGLSMDF
jgi:hypothetical protein